MAANAIQVISAVFVLAYATVSVINFMCLKYLKTTYDMGKSLYHILALDSSFVTILSFLNMGTFLYRTIWPEPGTITCSLILSSPMSSLSQPYLTCLISSIRFMTIYHNHPNGWKPEEQLIRWSHWCLLFVVCYFTGFVIANTYFDLNMFQVYNSCMGIDRPISKIWLMILVPILMVTFLTAIQDLLCWLIVKHRNHVQQQNFAPIDDEVAKKATLISFILTLPWLGFLAVILWLLDDFSPLVKFTFGQSLAILMLLIRNPIMARYAFRVNEMNQHIDAEEDRERRRNLEIREALEARKQREAKKITMFPEACEEGGNEGPIATVSGVVARNENSRLKKSGGMPDIDI